MKNDYEIALEVVKQNGFAFNHLSEELKKNKEIALTALKSSDAIMFASDLEEKHPLQSVSIRGCFSF
ncbi:MAG: DUF4116 domain-containing protein [SAR324 cluster bacterium]|nr:DUF4116 domain-containing protein [SAR324 cluster bacterium]